MSLIAALARARTEEDVKDAYIKALGLKQYNKGLVDIRTEEIWFEAKDAPTSPILMFAQLLWYVRDARRKGEHVPPFLAVIDREKAALMETAKAFPLLADASIKWPKSGSKVKEGDRVALQKSFAAQIAPYIETHFVVYRIESHEKEFVDAVKHAIKAGKFVRTPINPDNLRQVFDRWVEMIGCELEGVDETDYALLFFADIMFDADQKKTSVANLPARLLHEGDKPLFLLNGKTYELSSDKGYRNFWAIYHRPPEAEHRAYLLERRDSLLPLDERSFKGAFYTPLHIVDKAYDLLAKTLGRNWQQNYLVWDMCCGVGNLEVKHSNHRNLFMSTLDQADIDVMRASHTCVAATKFQYDYLNDDVDDFGRIDYSLTNKMPEALRQAIADAKAGKKGAKKILVLMNPPYAEAMNVDNTTAANGKNAETKKDVARTRIGASMDGMGYAARELFVQFLVRIQRELPGAAVAMFSTLKYVNAPNFASFREQWTAEYLGGFVVHSRAFDGLKGDFPIGFLVWNGAKNAPAERVKTIALNKDGNVVGEKTFYREQRQEPLSEWIVRPRSNKVDALPLKNAIVPATNTKDVRGDKWADGAIGSLMCKGNDFQNAATSTALFSSGYGSAGALFVTKANLWQAAIVFAVRRLIKPTWLNDRDQFLQPAGELPAEFQSDCLVWMLFNGSNLSAGADGLEWNGKTWSLVNHFIPYTEQEVGAAGRFESDFMSQYLAKLKLSKEAKAVLDEGRKLWRKFHATQFEKRIRDEFKLNRPDAGWYQVRRALEANAGDDPVDFDPFKEAFDELSRKLRPQVFERGFLRA
ncbi:MAG: hypothetical protein LKM32_13815 [Chiayiivirga sp.]|uniref:hypothetical protein n=1 Tax=Chiayiivirga sp. TaxID=2041042 RepID=UPI0025C2B1AE|nr:hypothetical protein [Chiayiivirga sp.]MCI1709983.1 hypothetical protein [Chiayiivirga sp.]MCI1730406.1 hypothetical protein [Chiayiivirga sp.]